MVYRECKYCGASLDPGERCDCAGTTTGYRRKITASKNALHRQIAKAFS